jgi:hypothetical protein
MCSRRDSPKPTATTFAIVERRTYFAILGPLSITNALMVGRRLSWGSHYGP